MAPHPAVALHCLGIPSDRLRQLAVASGLSLWDTAGDRSITGTRVILLLGHAWEDQVPAFFAPPYSAWIEVAALADRAILDLVGRAVGADCYASFTTISANRLDLAAEILMAVSARRRLADSCRDNIALALHEALCNALLHGNLQMDGIGDLSVGALERFSSNLTRRLSDPDFANRRIDIACGLDPDAITIDVADQGCGFEFKPKTEPKASGRGFELIEASCQSFRLLDGGRRISMRFPV